MPDQPLGGQIVFVGKHADRNTGLFQLLEKWEDAVIRLGAVHHALVIGGAEVVETGVNHGLRAFVFRNAALDQLTHAVARALARLLLGHSGEAAPHDRAVDAVAQVAEGVEQGTVQIKDCRVDFHAIAILFICLSGRGFSRAYRFA